MSETQNIEPSHTPRHRKPWVFPIRVLTVTYLLTLPACTHDAGHFGPGFFPLLAALFLVPLFAVISTLDAGFSWMEVALGDRLPSKIRTAGVMSVVSIAYWGVVAYVLLERTR